MPVNTNSIWRFVSNFFSFLNDTSRRIWEHIWGGIAYVAQELDKKAYRFLQSESPENSVVDPTIDYYDIEVNILKARPTYLDPTRTDSRYIIIPKKVIATTPVGVGRESVRNDMLEISKADYDDIRLLAIERYLVISSDNEDIDTRYFKIKNLKSPEETGDREFDLYVIELEEANLDYIVNEKKLNIYITDGKIYKVDKFVIDIPYLYTNISDYDGKGSPIGTTFVKDTDFTFNENYVEFVEDLIESGTLSNGGIVYAKNINIIEHNLFNNFGGLIGIKDWTKFRYDNISGKAAVNSLLKSLQNVSDRAEYERALNIYYGLPVAPDNCEVIGLFESYDYEVTYVDTGNNRLTLDLKSSTSLHPFFQQETRMIIDGSENIIYIPDTGYIDRTNGIIEVNDVSDISVGSNINIQLINKFNFVEDAEKSFSIKKGYYSDSKVRIIHATNGDDIKHIYDIIYALGQQEGLIKYPEMIIYGSRNENKNFDGFYHFKNAIQPIDPGPPPAPRVGEVEITVDDKISAVEEPNYNDFVDLTAGTTYTAGPGYVHIPWPTHKYLLLRLSDGTLYKGYLDAPIDTLYSAGDKLTKYTVLCRCISALDDDIFPDWYEFNGFRRNSGIDINSNIVELVDVIPYTKFGQYFPSQIS